MKLATDRDPIRDGVLAGLPQVAFGIAGRGIDGWVYNGHPCRQAQYSMPRKKNVEAAGEACRCSGSPLITDGGPGMVPALEFGAA